MDKLPKHKQVKLTNLYGEELEGTIIPLSIKGTMDVEAYLEELKDTLNEKSEEKIAKYIKALDAENPEDEKLFEEYVEGKIRTDLSKLNEEITDERVASLKEKRAKKLTADKTREAVLAEMGEMLFNLELRKQLMTRTVSRTLWNVLREANNLRKHLFVDVDDLEESLDLDTMVDIFTDIDENKVEEEDLKN
jgi:hypothetical protein